MNLFEIAKWMPHILKLLELLQGVIDTNREVAQTTRENTQQLAALAKRDDDNAQA